MSHSNILLYCYRLPILSKGLKVRTEAETITGWKSLAIVVGHPETDLRNSQHVRPSSRTTTIVHVAERLPAFLQ